MDIPNFIHPLQQPYMDRQLIVVADDAVVKLSRETAIKELQKKDLKDSINWERITDLALRAALGSAAGLITVVAKEAYAAWTRARDAGINIVQISKSEAATITFPPGHPKDGVLYIGHPAIPNVYYTTAEFHRVTFEHKFSEAVRLLMHLGATEINVEHMRGWSHDFSGNITAPMPTTEATIGAGVKSGSSNENTVLFRATLDGTDNPRIPDQLSWFPHEATWQSIAEARIKFGLREFALSVTYNDDFGVNAGLKATIMKTGLDVGGRFEGHTSTEWRILGKFKSKDPTI